MILSGFDFGADWRTCSPKSQAPLKLPPLEFWIWHEMMRDAVVGKKCCNFGCNENGAVLSRKGDRSGGEGWVSPLVTADMQFAVEQNRFSGVLERGGGWRLAELTTDVVYCMVQTKNELRRLQNLQQSPRYAVWIGPLIIFITHATGKREALAGILWFSLFKSVYQRWPWPPNANKSRIISEGKGSRPTAFVQSRSF